MNARAHKAFIINFFMDDGIGHELGEALQLVTTESAINVLAQHTNDKTEKNESFPRYQDDQFKEQFRLQRISFEVNHEKKNKLWDLCMICNLFLCRPCCELLVMQFLERNITNPLHKSRCQKSYSTHLLSLAAGID